MSVKSDIEKGLWDELSESAQKKAEEYLNTSRPGRGGKLKVTINKNDNVVVVLLLHVFSSLSCRLIFKNIFSAEGDDLLLEGVHNLYGI